MNKFTNESISQVRSKIKNGSLKAQDVIESTLEHCRKINPKINAIVQFSDAAIKEAKEIDRKIQQKRPIGKLAGIPITVKDTYHVSGFTPSQGCKYLYKKPSTFDATIIRRLKEEDAIIIGLTNVPELLIGYNTKNTLYGETKNPFNLSVTTGGSSGGDAAIVASEGSALGIGSDAAGSVRLPAFYCGVVGFRPTQNTMPLSGLFPSNSHGYPLSILSPGIIARYVSDIALANNIMQGPDNIDPNTLNIMTNTNTKNIHELNIGILLSNKTIQVETEIENAIDDVMHALNDITHKVELIDNNLFDHIFHIVHELDTHNASLAFAEALLKNTAKRDLPNFFRQTQQTQITGYDIYQRLAELDQWKFSIMRLFQSYDVIISPTAPTVAKPNDKANESLSDIFFVLPFSILGGAAISIPIKLNSTALPIGIQIASKPGHDDICLKIASLLEEIFQGYQPPRISYE